MSQLLCICIAISAGYSLFHVLRARRGKAPLPPGPPSDPLIGHLRQLIPPVNEDTYHEWHHRYGPVSSIIFTLGGYTQFSSLIYQVMLCT